MKIFILIMAVVAASGFAQETGHKEDAGIKKVPEIGRKVLPLAQEQEQDQNPSTPNPFQIGPYEGGRYIYTAPEEKAETQE